MVTCKEIDDYLKYAEEHPNAVSYDQMRMISLQVKEHEIYKLDELTKRVDKHNNVVERTYNIEERLSVQEEQIKVANHRIEDLEKGERL